MKYIYFVSYCYNKGHGNSQITQDSEMNTLEHIRSAQELIASTSTDFNECIINNFQLFRTEED